jgi:hypothetical protein
MDKEYTERVPGECIRGDPGRNRALLFFNEASYNMKCGFVESHTCGQWPIAGETGIEAAERKRRK